MGKRKKTRVVSGLVVVSLVVAGLAVIAGILAGNLQKQPKLRLLLAGKHLIEQTWEEEDFLLYGLDIQELVRSYGNADTRASGQIRVSELKGLDKVTLAFHYDAKRSVLQQKAAANIELQVLRFPLGSLEAYLDGQRLYVTIPEYLEEPFAIDTDMALFQALPEPEEKINRDWVRKHRKELLEILQATKVEEIGVEEIGVEEIGVEETGVVEDGQNDSMVKGEIVVKEAAENASVAKEEIETERFHLTIPVGAVKQLAALLELPLMSADVDLEVDLDLTRDNRISGIMWEIPREFLPGTKTVVSLRGDHLQLLEWKQESEQADQTLTLQRLEDTGLQMELYGEINWKQGRLAERQYTVSGSIRWEEQNQDFNLEVEDVIIEQDGEKLIKLDGNMKLIPWEGEIEAPREELTASKVWNIEELIKELNGMSGDAARLFQGLRGIQ